MKTALALIVAVLLGQFLLRTHDVLTLPGYADESLHIRRAEVAWDFSDSVASWQPGKLMLYYYLGLFETERINALLVSRLAVALMSLLSGAAIYGLGKALHSRRAGLLAMILYAVTPYAVFYDRMALADPPTVAVFTLTVLSLLHWSRRPTLRRSILSGFLMALVPFSKLTGMGVVFVPVMMVVLYPLTTFSRFYLTPKSPLRFGEGTSSVQMGAFSPSPRWRGGRGVRSIAIIYGIFAAVWIPLMIPTLVGEVRGGEDRVALVDDYLLNVHEENQAFLPNLIDNIWQALDQIGIYVWTPALALVVLGGIILIWGDWRAALLLWGVLLLAWLPTTAGSEMARTRYLTLGLPFLILLGVLGVYTAIDHLPKMRRGLEIGLFGAALIYALAWGLPFYQTAIRQPSDLTLPAADRWRYMQAVTAGYGQQEAAYYLENEGGDGPVRAVGILGSCHLMRLFLQDPGPVHLICADLLPGHQLSEAETDEIHATADAGPLYLLIERDLGANFDDLEFEWTFVREFPRPHDGVTIELWSVKPS